MIMSKQVLVWDLPVRVFHWLLVICFAGAWFSAESEKYQLIHYAFGYTAGVLVLFRIVWGFLGTRYARFYDFIKGPKTVIHHLKHIFSAHEEHYLGHNPAGSIIMVVLMFVVLANVMTGYWNVKGLYETVNESWHEGLANITLVLISIHVLAAIVMSYLSKKNLVKSMVTGKKLGQSVDGITSQQNVVGIILFVSILVCFILILNGIIPALTT
jgi:cytochrome b